MRRCMTILEWVQRTSNAALCVDGGGTIPTLALGCTFFFEKPLTNTLENVTIKMPRGAVGVAGHIFTVKGACYAYRCCEEVG